MIINDNVPIIKKQYLLHYLSNHMYCEEETRYSDEKIIGLLKSHPTCYSPKTFKRNLNFLLQNMFPGNPAYVYFPNSKKNRTKDKTINCEDLLLPKKEKKTHLHTQVFYRLLKNLTLPSVHSDSLLKPVILSNNKDKNCNNCDRLSLVTTKSFTPIFVSIVYNYREEKKEWKFFKETILKDSKIIIEEIFHNKMDSYEYTESEWLKIWNETAKNWLDLFLPDDLFELCNNIQQFQERHLLFPTPGMLAMNLQTLVDLFFSDRFYTLTAQNKFYTHLNQLFDNNSTNHEKIFINNMQKIQELHSLLLKEDIDGYPASLQKPYIDHTTIRKAIRFINNEKAY